MVSKIYQLLNKSNKDPRSNETSQRANVFNTSKTIIYQRRNHNTKLSYAYKENTKRCYLISAKVNLKYVETRLLIKVNPT